MKRSKDALPTKQALFPRRLHDLLGDAEKNSAHADIVSWMPDGKAFKIHKPNEFSESIMKQYFKQSKLKSFTRQVRYLWARNVFTFSNKQTNNQTNSRICIFSLLSLVV